MRRFIAFLYGVLLLTTAVSSNAQTTGRYLRLEGTVAGQPVVMHLVVSEGNAHGFYYYTRVGQPISLISYYNEEKTSSDSIVLGEWTAGNEQSGALKLVVGADSVVTGVWMNADSTKQLPVNLHEEYPAGSIPLAFISYSDSAVKRFRDGSVSSESSIEIPLPKPGTTYASEFLITSVANAIDCTASDRNVLVQCIKRGIQQTNDTALAELIDQLQDNGDTVGENEFMYHWSRMTQVQPRYNDHDILALDCLEEEYTGGAHPNYGTTELLLDIRNRKILSLRDITTADKRTLGALLDASVRKQFHLQKGQTLSDVLFEDHIEPSKEIYITDKGIGFLYSPYEVAAYAYGELDLFIPFSALKGKLTAWTTERFGVK